MGRPKLLLAMPAQEGGGGTLLEWLCSRLAPGFDELLICAPPEQVPERLRQHARPDLRAGLGPLAGIETALLASASSLVAVVATDMPWVGPDVLATLRSAVRGQEAAAACAAGQVEPLCAVYRTSVLARVQQRLDDGRLAARGLLDDLQVVLVEIDPDRLRSLNTPGDYERFRGSLG